MSEKHADLTKRIIRAFYNVYNNLGYGFLEKVYENALAIELRNAQLQTMQQHPIQVSYKGQLVGEYYADLLVNDLILIELKSVREVTEIHEAQLLNYLKATPYEVGLLFNYGPKPNVMRRVYDNELKINLRSQQVTSSTSSVISGYK